MKLSSLQAAPALGPDFPLPLDQPFHRQEALRAGVPVRWLSALVRSGHLRRVLQGVYVSASVPDSVPLRIAALALVVPDGAVVCDRHAAWLHGTTAALAPGEHLAPTAIRLARLPGVTRIQRSAVDSRQRALLACDVTEVGGVLVTTALRTALDLGRVRRPVEALSGVDAMLRVGVSRDEVADEVERFAGERWVSTLRSVLPLADPRSASPGESAVKWHWFTVTGEKPDLQVRLAGPTGAPVFLDVGSPTLRFAVEYDGREWHTAPEQVEHDRTRRTFVADVHGYDVAVVVAENVYGEARNIDAVIREGLRRAASRRAA